LQLTHSQSLSYPPTFFSKSVCIRMRLQAFLILFICLGMPEANGQTIKRLGGAVSYGSIIAHATELRPISNSNPTGITGSFQFMDVGRKSWEACDCFYFLGADLSFENFNNPKIL